MDNVDCHSSSSPKDSESKASGVREAPIKGLLPRSLIFEISGLADRFLMEIEENVNPETQKGEFSEIPFGNRKNMQYQIVVCDSSK